ncbi:type I-E CRISPR-associated endonuclease Cas1e [Paratractidigestivibacter sp.]|uniref:type I-E CRISPR-associated endonuclease Cas1e n=2 Tax=Paratractidigestivibacter sp. TaxID=2847316 RepID=UPI002ACB133C|nr:type I-E CRISPR-associated endonuclease Cas1e [Paratractidigestivibacter sp.]
MEESGGDKSQKASNAIPGSPPSDIMDLSRMEDRMSFAYFERCTINRSDNAITVENAAGTIYVPAASLSVLMLGPGTKVTHRAMELIGENGATVIWVGERGVRMYAFGKPLTHSSALLQRQAALVSNSRSRLAVARRMYEMRFEGEDVSGLTMQQLRGREGARVRKAYRACAKETGVAWTKRSYNPNDFDSGSEIDQALTAAHTCLYGLVHAAIVSLGCSPGLGFVHTGHERSFVYDIADLYKAEISIPVAFRITAKGVYDIPGEVRRAMRDEFYRTSLVKKVVKDIKSLLLFEEDAKTDGDNLYLWDEKCGEVPSGVQYSSAVSGEEIEGDVP